MSTPRHGMPPGPNDTNTDGELRDFWNMERHYEVYCGSIATVRRFVTSNARPWYICFIGVYELIALNAHLLALFSLQPRQDRTLLPVSASAREK